MINLLIEYKLPLIIVLGFVASCSTPKKTEEPPEEVTEEIAEEPEVMEESPVESQKLSKADSVWMLEQIRKLTFIEQMAIGEDFYLYANILNYKGNKSEYQVLHDQLTEHNGYFVNNEILSLDPKNGYIQYARAESILTVVYWNKSDGSKLVAHEITGCGPVCESSITFSTYDSGNISLLEEVSYLGIRKFENGKFQRFVRYADGAKSAIIPQARELASILIEDYDENDPDPIEFNFVLPQNGKDIKFCLESECITLSWKDGSFQF